MAGRAKLDITPLSTLVELLTPLWEAPDYRDLTISDELWCDWVDFWNRLSPENRRTRARPCDGNRHEFVGIASGGQVCRVCCKYLGSA